MRISERVLTDTVRNDLNNSLSNLTSIGTILATGKKINAPSDDPAGTGTVMRLTNDIDINDQFSRSTGAATARLSSADTALGNLTDVLQRARELTVQAGAGSHSQSELNAISTELNQLLLHAVQIGNTNVGGQYLFSGTKSTTAAFAPAAGPIPASVAFNGNTNPIAIQTDRSTQTRVDVPGDAAFLPTMNAIIQIRDALTAGNAANGVQTALTAFDGALDSVSAERGKIGATVNGLESASARIGTEQTDLKSQRSDLQDMNIADTIVKLNAAQNLYQSALGAAAKAIQPSLVEFLR
jgi:flagellar hook-associated protein 3 FlgL